MNEETFVFESFRLIPAQRMLLDDGKPLRLGGRALDILITLVERAGETIPKEQLIARTSPDTVVDEAALPKRHEQSRGEGLAPDISFHKEASHMIGVAARLHRPENTTRCFVPT